MPKFTYSAAKGIEQSSGSGFIVADVPVIEDVETKTGAPLALQAWGTSIVSGANDFTLAAGTYVGQTKTILCGTFQSTTRVLSSVMMKVNGDDASTGLTFSADGESWVGMWNGTRWVPLNVNTGGSLA